MITVSLLAFAFDEFGQIGAIVELSLEQLNSNDGEDEIEEHVDDKDIEDVLERIDNAIEDCFELRNSIDGLEWSQHSQYSKRFDRV